MLPVMVFADVVTVAVKMIGLPIADLVAEDTTLVEVCVNTPPPPPPPPPTPPPSLTPPPPPHAITPAIVQIIMRDRRYFDRFFIPIGRRIRPNAVKPTVAPNPDQTCAERCAAFSAFVEGEVVVRTRDRVAGVTPSRFTFEGEIVHVEPAGIPVPQLR